MVSPHRVGDRRSNAVKTRGLGGQDPEQEPPQSATTRTHLSLTDAPHESRAAIDERAERERQARRHKKELRLAQQRRQRRVLSRPAATTPVAESGPLCCSRGRP